MSGVCQTLMMIVVLSCGIVKVQSKTKENKELLIGGLFPMSGDGWSGGQACLPATQMALKDVNNRQDLLPGYTLKLSVKNSECQPGLGLHKMYELLYKQDTKIVLLSGCSLVSTFVAQAAHMWNLIVLSYGSSSPALSNRDRFPTFFRTHPSATINNPTRVKMFQQWGWKRIATIQQTEEVFTSTVQDLEERLKDSGIEIAVRANFLTDPEHAVRTLKRQDARIIVGVFYETMARKVMCQAYKLKLYGKKYVWFLIGWYPDNWYMQSESDVNCTVDEMKVVLEGHMTTEALVLYKEKNVTETGLTASKFTERLNKALNVSDPTRIVGYVEAPLAYDAIWALAFALNRSINSLKLKSMSIDDFVYSNQQIAEDIYSSVNRTKFLGVSGPVSFTAQGDRISWTQIEQMTGGVYKKIAFYDYSHDVLEWNSTNPVRWIDGRPPQDSTIIQTELLLIDQTLYITMSTLAVLGILCGVIALCYTTRLMGSVLWDLNTLCVVGFIVCLLCVFMSGLDGRYLNKDHLLVVCQIKAWTLCVGFTLAYGSLFSKITVVYRMNTKKKKSLKQELSTLQLAAIVGFLLLVDLVILVTWHLVNTQYIITDSFALENPQNSLQDIKRQPIQQHCTSENLHIWIGLIFSYKGLLLIIGVLFSYDTRRADQQPFEDGRFIRMAIYNVAVLSFITAPVMLIINGQQNATFTFLSAAIILSSIISIGLICLPKILRLHSSSKNASNESLHLMTACNNQQYKQLQQQNDKLKEEIKQKENILHMLRDFKPSKTTDGNLESTAEL